MIEKENQKDLEVELEDFEEVEESTIIFTEDDLLAEGNKTSPEDDLRGIIVNEMLKEDKGIKIDKEVMQGIISGNKEVVKKVLVGVIAFSLILGYFYLVKPERYTNTKPLVSSDITSNKNHTLVDENDNEPTDEHIEVDLKGKKGEITTLINEDIKSLNNDSLSKLKNYVDLKINRQTLLNGVQSNRDEKIELYRTLKENEKLFKNEEDAFNKLDDLIIKYISMDEEILQAFEDKNTNKLINDILEKYKD